MKILHFTGLYLVLCCFIFPLGPFTRAQETPAIFIDSINVIENNLSLSSFYKKMNEMEYSKRRVVTIYQIGDSHVNSGFMPLEFSVSIKSQFGDGGGMIYSNKSKRRRKSSRNNRGKSLYSIRTMTDDFIVSEQEETVTDYQEVRGIRFFSYGVSGKDFRYFSDYDNIIEHLRNSPPDLIIISLGTNDAVDGNLQKKHLLHSIVTFLERIRRVNDTANILFTLPGDAMRKGKQFKNIELVCETIREVCLTHNYAYWDFYRVMGGAGSIETWATAGLAGRDKIHLTKEGYSKQGALLFEALMKGYTDFLFRFPK